LECVSPYSRFVDIGQTESSSREGISQGWPENASYFSLDIAALLRYRPATIASALQRVGALLAATHIEPVEMSVFKPSAVNEALKRLATGSSNGKMVVEMDHNDVVEVCSYAA
jgi:NADPH:quinone reductase-like Zn-dependent oxidoreductase